MGMVFGTAPDSWGIWEASHASQLPWSRFLDEVAEAGYSYVELGPYGYLPTDAAELGDALGQRGLELIAGTLIDDLYVPAERPRIRERARRICGLASALDARFLVLIQSLYRTPETGLRGPTELDPAAWRALVEFSDELGRLARDEFGMDLTFHPHADSVVEYRRQVDRLLDDTDSSSTHLCLDTGHFEIRDGDSAQLMRERFERIPYLHLKSLDPVLRERVRAGELDFATAVALGVMVEPDDGTVDFEAIDRAMAEVSWDGWAIVEQDMFPLDDHDRPLPTATRTRHYFERLGWRTR